MRYNRGRLYLAASQRLDGDSATGAEAERESDLQEEARHRPTAVRVNM